MRLLVPVVFLLSVTIVQAQANDGGVTTAIPSSSKLAVGDKIIYGSRVDFGLPTLLGKALELVVAPRSFRRNWPLYGYAIPTNPNSSPCGDLEAKYSNLPIGRAAIVLPKPDGNVHSGEYIGLPVQGFTMTGTGDLAVSIKESGGQSDWTYSQFNIGDFCGWLDDPAALAEAMQKIVVLPYDLSDGDWNRIDSGEIPYDSAPLMSGQIARENATSAIPTFTWTKEMGDAQSHSEKLVWMPILDESLVGDKPSTRGDIVWRYDAGGSTDGGKGPMVDYYLSWRPSSKFSSCEDTAGEECGINWSLPDHGEVKLKGISRSEDLSGSAFTMWYAPKSHQSGAPSLLIPQDWYVLTEEPLPALDTDVRIAAPLVSFAR